MQIIKQNPCQYIDNKCVAVIQRALKMFLNTSGNFTLAPGEVRVFYGQTSPHGYTNSGYLLMSSSIPDMTGSGMKYWDWYRVKAVQPSPPVNPPATEPVTVTYSAGDTPVLKLQSPATRPSTTLSMDFVYSLGKANGSSFGNISANYDWLIFGAIDSNKFSYLQATDTFTGTISDTPFTAGAISANSGKFPIGISRFYLTNESDTAVHPKRFLIDANPRAALLRGYSAGKGYPSAVYAMVPNYELRAADAGVGPGQIPGLVGALNDSARNVVLGYWGGGNKMSENGVSFVSLFEVPLRPLCSLGELQHLPVEDWHNSPSYVIGNSFASPYVNSAKVVDGSAIAITGIAGTRFQTQIDHSYLGNLALFDSYFFSGLAPRADLGLTQSELKDALVNPSDPKRQSGGALESGVLPDPRLRLISNAATSNSTTMNATTALSAGGTNGEKPYSLSSALLVSDGAFNVNSTSVEAWKAFLKSVSSPTIPTLLPTASSITQPASTGYPFPRVRPTNGGAFTKTSGGAAADRWKGYFSLTDAQVDTLAAEIVRQVKERGPFLSLADFVNRRLAASSDAKSQRGALQAAIEAAGVNNPVFASVSPTDYFNNANAVGAAAAAAPGYLTQADILQALGSHLTARGDTFLIRSYGDCVNPKGKVESRAWCEAVVQRFPEKVNPAENISDPPANPAKDFGRRFRVVSFRWLGEEEI